MGIRWGSISHLGLTPALGEGLQAPRWLLHPVPITALVGSGPRALKDGLLLYPCFLTLGFWSRSMVG